MGENDGRASVPAGAGTITLETSYHKSFPTISYTSLVVGRASGKGGKVTEQPPTPPLASLLI